MSGDGCCSWCWDSAAFGLRLQGGALRGCHSETAKAVEESVVAGGGYAAGRQQIPPSGRNDSALDWRRQSASGRIQLPQSRTPSGMILATWRPTLRNTIRLLLPIPEAPAKGLEKLADQGRSCSMSPCKAMYPGRIVGGKLRPRWRGSFHRTSETFVHKTYILDVASHGRSPPALALEHFENLFALQSIRGLHMTDRLHGVGAPSEHLAECRRRNIANPVSDAAVSGDFGGQCIHRRSRQIQQ